MLSTLNWDHLPSSSALHDGTQRGCVVEWAMLSIVHALEAAAVATAWSYDMCLGKLRASGDAAGTSHYEITRTPGGPARVSGNALQAGLLPLDPASGPSRNGARLYLANRCTEGKPSKEAYAAIPLLGRTLSVTVDLSAAQCGCNVAFYLSFLRESASPGTCNGDFYCDANEVCGLRCAEVDIMEAVHV